MVINKERKNETLNEVKSVENTHKLEFSEAATRAVL